MTTGGLRRVLWATIALALAAPAAAGAEATSVDGPSADITAGARIDLDVAPDGTAAMAYLKKVGGVDHAFVVRKQGAGWGPAERVDTGLLTASLRPSIGVGNGGKVVVAFSNATKLYSAIASGGGAFSAPAQVTTLGSWSVSDMDLGASGNGYLAAITDGGQSDLYAFHLQGTTWTKVGAAFPADALDDVIGDSSGDGDQRGPRVAVTPDGASATVVWTDDAGLGAYHLVARRLAGTAAAGIGPAVTGSLANGTLLGTAPAVDSANDMGDVGVDATGNAWVVYRQNFTYVGDKGRALARSFDGTTFGPIHLVDGLPTPPPEAAEVPRIDVNSSGQALETNARQLFFDFDSASLTGGVWSAGAQLNTTPNTLTGRSAPALADSGAGMVTYASTPGGAAKNESLARIRALDGTLGPPVTLSDPNFGDVSFSFPEAGADAGTFAATAFTQGAVANVRVVAAVVALPQPPAVVIPTSGGGQPAPDTTRPVITRLRISPSKLRAGTRALARITAKKKKAKQPATATVSLTLSEAARVTFTAERLTKGRRVNGRCVRATRANRRRASCTRATAAGGSVSVALPEGASRVRFAGRLRTKLAAGSYRLVAAARDGAGNRSAKPARVSFTVLAAPRKAVRR